MHLASAANVVTPAYLTILGKGYVVRREGDLIIAEKGDDTFVADDPIQLLGVIVVGETRGERWQATDEQIADFLAAFGE